ncbi:hypothetical protein SeLEV6574_g05309 [Synchytrium endobioticum]|uniref:CBS domain-containing protein n=1 Tax=Synchytrium endobioticum TaxID=286115 RepID=A0A507CUZ8_9FUNG|nr:hypothetical protein SeLEV6574_g05309 [Synchytrium endobioticum]
MTLEGHLLSRIRASKLGNKLIDVNPDVSIVDALQLMRDHQLYALPVAEPEDSEYKYKAIISLSDLLTPMFSEERAPVVMDNGTPGHRVRFLQQPLRSILKQPSDPLENTTNAIKDVLHHLYQNRGHIPPQILNEFATKAMQSVKTSADHVHSPALMPAITPALEVAEALASQQLSCVGITQEDGRLVANISWADFRGLNGSAFSKLVKPCLEFVKEVQGVDPSERHFSLVSSRATIEAVMKVILENRVHS